MTLIIFLGLGYIFEQFLMILNLLHDLSAFDFQFIAFLPKFALQKSVEVNSYLKSRIAEGEHLQQDFKFAINDSKKIARSLAAFANTEGGRLLVGVKDNGRIAGVASEEEFYMIEAAATRYCRPPIAFEPHEHQIEGKTVVEIIVPKSGQKPHKAPSRDGKYKVYVRVKDQNLLANRILLKVWLREKNNTGTFFQLKEPEQILLTFLNQKERYITHSKFTRIAGISRKKAEKILVNLIVLGILEIKLTENGAFYYLRESETENDGMEERSMPDKIQSL